METSTANPPLADDEYAINPSDGITLVASKIIRDVLVTRGEPIRRQHLIQVVELVMGAEGRPDVDGVLKRNWFSNQGTGPGRWELTDAAEARESPFLDASGSVNLARVVEYLRRCRGEAPYIGDVGDFIQICQPEIRLDAAWLLQSGRALG